MLESVQKEFEQNDYDAVNGDLQYVLAGNTRKIIRKWNAGPYNREKLKRGWMPPHPTLFIKKMCTKNTEIMNYRTQ